MIIFIILIYEHTGELNEVLETVFIILALFEEGTE